jgi:hypothetical protein
MSSSDFFQIDPNALDREWVQQPALYHKYAVRLANARRDAEQAETLIDVVYAELDAAIRANPEKYGVAKITEPSVKAAILGHRKYKAATAAHIEAKHAAGILQAAVSTMDHRKRAFENLVDLRLADYFSEPRTTSGREQYDRAKKRQARRPVAGATDDE